jgi:glucose-6-phosphate isomerase
MPTFEQYLAWRVALSQPAVELDLSDAGLDREGLSAATPALRDALAAMQKIEAGALANPDEGRMVGHYWLRAPELAPDPTITAAIRASWDQIEAFAVDFHAGAIAAADGQRFRDVLLIGIGGSALGPQLLADALGGRLHVLDNTDPAGIARTLAALPSLAHTLVLVTSKSGSTVETRNGMLEVAAACRRAGLHFPAQAVAITGHGSTLDQLAARDRWLARFPLWDWVGGRTSVLAPVGLLPAALLGLDWRGLLRGAAAMDLATREPEPDHNPAALLAHAWFVLTGGHGRKAMVMLPYADRLVLLSRYLQQLVMESLGKRLDRQGREVFQGLTVYGNKGSTDQHAYVQQLRDGLPDFFAAFVRVLDPDLAPPAIEVEAGVTSADCLDGFYQGTRAALAEQGRHSLTLTLDRLDAPTLGAVLALFERSVGLYAELLDINAYHQPGVEAGKLAARAVIALQHRLLAALDETPRDVVTLARQLEAEPFAVWQVARHLATDGRLVAEQLSEPARARFSRRPSPAI